MPSSQITWVSPDSPSTSRSSRSTAAGPAVALATTGGITRFAADGLVDDAHLVSIGIVQSAGKHICPAVIGVKGGVRTVRDGVTKGTDYDRVTRGHHVHRGHEKPRRGGVLVRKAVHILSVIAAAGRS